MALCQACHIFLKLLQPTPERRAVQAQSEHLIALADQCLAQQVITAVLAPEHQCSPAARAADAACLGPVLHSKRYQVINLAGCDCRRQRAVGVPGFAQDRSDGAHLVEAGRHYGGRRGC
jgi:hypothetical protein